METNFTSAHPLKNVWLLFACCFLYCLKQWTSKKIKEPKMNKVSPSHLSQQ